MKRTVTYSYSERCWGMEYSSYDIKLTGRYRYASINGEPDIIEVEIKERFLLVFNKTRWVNGDNIVYTMRVESDVHVCGE